MRFRAQTFSTSIGCSKPILGESAIEVQTCADLQMADFLIWGDLGHVWAILILDRAFVFAHPCSCFLYHVLCMQFRSFLQGLVHRDLKRSARQSSHVQSIVQQLPTNAPNVKRLGLWKPGSIPCLPYLRQPEPWALVTSDWCSDWA